MHRRNKLTRGPAGLTVAALAAAATVTGGCDEYLDRSDTITLGVADATDHNKAVHTITRWPKEARQDRWLTDGERVRSSIARYRANKVTPPKTLSGKVGDVATEAAPVADTTVTGGPAEK
jgi:ABC-type uncharacterized transport system auxiliary subunit